MDIVNLLYFRILGLNHQKFCKNLNVFTDGIFIKKVIASFFYNLPFRFLFFTDLIVRDEVGKTKRFFLSYIFQNIVLSSLKFFITFLVNNEDSVDSINKVYPGSNWIEREAWDLMGVNFKNNLDLKRILTDYGFDGHPLRKDFPLTGYYEIYYNDLTKRIMVENLELAQEYRDFEYYLRWKSE